MTEKKFRNILARNIRQQLGLDFVTAHRLAKEQPHTSIGLWEYGLFSEFIFANEESEVGEVIITNPQNNKTTKLPFDGSGIYWGILIRRWDKWQRLEEFQTGKGSQ